MRYFVGFVCVLALAAVPRSVSAQQKEEGAIPEPDQQDPTPSAEPAPEEPALEMNLGADGVEVAPSYPQRTDDGYTREEMEVRVRRAKGGCGGTAGVLALGVGLVIGGVVYESSDLSDVGVQPTLLAMGILVTVAGAAGMALSCNKLAARKGQLRTLQEAHYGRPRRVQWDLAQSRLVF